MPAVPVEPATAEAALTAAWASALGEAVYLPMSPPEIERFVGPHSARLVAGLCGDPHGPDWAQQAGAALVGADFVGADVLGRTIATVGDELRLLATAIGPAAAAADRGSPAGACPVGAARDGAYPDGVGAGRLSRLQGALAAGFVQAARDRTLDEQESIRRAEVAARAQVEAALRASEARFRAVFADAGIGIGLADMQGRVVEVNHAFADTLGYTIGEFLRMRVTDFDYPDDAPGMWDVYRDILSGRLDYARMEKRYRHRDGHIVWTDLVVSLIRDPGGGPLYTVAMVQDISDRRELAGQLRHQALHDPLTGLPNRALFQQRLAAAFADPERWIGVCYLDLDGFKVVNDTLGHHVGDELLVAVARRLQGCVRGDGELVARMGGDEFVILVEDAIGLEGLTSLAAATLAAFEPPFAVAGHQLVVSASIGVVERSAAQTTPEEFMKAADITLYWAKSDGRSRWAVLDPDRHARDQTRHTLSASLLPALRRGEFVLDYQPLVGLLDGRMHGLEALVRWRHPTLGRLMPDEFIDLAEESGGIVPLGRWVLQQACRQAQQWNRRAAAGAELFVSVNLAVRQTRDPDLVTDVARILADTRLPPRLLQLELTESAVMGTTGRPIAALHELAGMGVRIAIDDFGTGYSNLAYLSRLPLHALKLAGSFIEGLRGDSREGSPDEPIVATLVSLAHTLGLTVTAEGVEAGEQVERLRAIGCDTAQGWYFARASPPEAIDELLGRR